MKKWRIISVVVLACMLMGIFASCGFDNSIKGDLGTINGESLLSEDFAVHFMFIQKNLLTNMGIEPHSAAAKEFWKTTELEGKKAADIAREYALEQFIMLTIFKQKANEMGLTLTEEDKQQINESYAASVTEAGGNKAFEDELKKYDVTPEAYRRYMEYVILLGKVNQEISISTEYMEKYGYPSLIRAKHILISTVDQNTNQPLSESEIANAKAKADDLYNQIINGADFDTLMLQYGQDPGVASNPDGYTFGKGEMVKEFEKAAYALEVGEVSQPVKSSFGYHIIKREKHEDFEMAVDVEAVYEQWELQSDIKLDNEKISSFKVLEK